MTASWGIGKQHVAETGMRRVAGNFVTWLTLIVLSSWLPGARGQMPVLSGTDQQYVRWLEERSILYQAGQKARLELGSEFLSWQI